MRFLIFILIVFLPISTAHAAWTYTQNMDGLTGAGADLNGQDSWSGGTGYDVTTAGTMQGTKYVNMITSTEQDMQRTVTSSTSGVMSVMMRKGSASALIWDVRINSGATIGTFVRFSPDGNIYQLHSGSTVLQTYTAATNYAVETEYDVATDQYRVRIDGGAWSSWQVFYLSATFTSVDRIFFSKQDAGTQGVSFDDIKDTTPAGVSSNPLQNVILFE